MLGIPQAALWIIELVEEAANVAPGQLSHRLWDIFLIWPGGRKLAHVMDVATREALHLRKLSTKIRREPLDDFPAPALLLLAFENLLADTPVEPDQLLVDRKRGTRACRADLSLEARKQLGIAVRKGRSGKGLAADHCLHYRNVRGRLPSPFQAAPSSEQAHLPGSSCQRNSRMSMRLGQGMSGLWG
jgi:hypothetical protein